MKYYYPDSVFEDFKDPLKLLGDSVEVNIRPTDRKYAIVSFSETRDIALSVPEHRIFNSAFTVYFIVSRNIRRKFFTHCNHRNKGLKFNVKLAIFNVYSLICYHFHCNKYEAMQKWAVW